MSPARKYFNSIKPIRDAWIKEFCINSLCMGCRCYKKRLDCHEIERRSSAPKRFGDPCNYLALCRNCHSFEFASMSHSRQLAFKKLFDLKNYNLRKWLSIKDPDLKAICRVTEDDVDSEVCFLLTRSKPGIATR